MTKINLAILGFGFMGRVYSYAANVLHNFYPDAPKISIESVLVSKDNKELNEELVSRYGFKEVTSNLERIIQNDDINAVYVASPNNFHYDQVLSSLEANKNILCEKPFTVSLNEAKELVKLKDKKENLVGNIVFEYRFIPAIQEIKSILSSGKLGEITQFRFLYLHGSYAEDREITWRLKKGTGGALVDLGPHVIDLVQHILGPINILESNSQTKFPGREVDDYAQIICRTEKGSDGYLEVSRLSTGSLDDLRIEIHGYQGSISWSLQELNYFKLFLKDTEYPGYTTIPCFTSQDSTADFPPPKVSSGWLMPHVHCLYSFTKQIEDRSFQDLSAASFKDGF